jgi:hypothetical protein
MASKNGWLWSVGMGSALGPASWLRPKSAPRTKPAPAAGQTVYHGNEKSLAFHQPGCRYYDCPDCTASFNSREQALEAGYEPCKVCKP